MRYGVLAAVLFFLLAGCDTAVEDPYEEQLVLQGLMYLDETPKVCITQTVPANREYSVYRAALSRARVELYTSPWSFVLLQSNSAEDSARGVYSNSSLTMQPGQTYRLYIEVGEWVLEAETVAAGRVTITGHGPPEVEYGGVPFTVSWLPDTLAAGYAIVIVNQELDWNAAYRRVGNELYELGTNTVHWYANRHETSFTIPWSLLGFTGWHEVRVISCDRTLWDYLLTADIGTSEAPPVSNVRGGLGVFAVAGADTTGFELVDNIRE